MATQAEITASPEISSWEDFSICLPHPYMTRYHARAVPGAGNTPSYRFALAPVSDKSGTNSLPPLALHDAGLSFSSLEQGQDIKIADNTQWARAQRSPSTTITWISSRPPTVAQLWLIIYSLFTVHFSEETIRLALVGEGKDIVSRELVAVGLAIPHPSPANAPASSTEGLVLLRSSFWQGAGSPFGTRPVWLPVSSDASQRQPLESFPLIPSTQTQTTKFPAARIHALHPVRPAKPAPGSTIYSRWIPHLNEHFSMVALDYTQPEHLQLFHSWQNDPRVAAGWNESGTVEHHRRYLQELHEDPHTLTIIAKFDDAPFAYFEVYWAKEDHLGAYYHAGDWDRGRHSLVGDTAFRGPHRAHAWWSSLMHYMFLDDPRTQAAVGEPKLSNTRVLELDALHGFHVEKYVDLPHKRSALVRCSRERYFAICTVGSPYEGRSKKDVKERL